MNPIYKFELRTYRNSPVTYVFAGLFFMICAIYFFIDNIRGRSGDMTSFYNSMSIILLFMLPVFTARTISDDRKSGFEMLLITSPVSILRIILGKFWAVMNIILAMLASTVVFPLFLSLFAHLSVRTLLIRYAGLILLSASIVALGIFISSLTESQVAAAIISLIALLILFVARPIGTAIGGKPAKVIAGLSVFSRFTTMNEGVFTVGTVVYDISFIFVFLFLTIQTMEFRRLHGGGK